MEKKIAAFTAFTFLLFAVSSARISVDPAAIDPSVVYAVSNTIKSSPESVSATAAGDSRISLPSENSKSESDETPVDYRLQEPEKPRTYTVNTIDLTSRSNFVGFRPINRHFLDRPRIPLRRRPCRHKVKPFAIPRSEISYGNDMILSGEIGGSDSETDRNEVPMKRLKFRHNYGHRHHHSHQDDDDNEFAPRHVFDREKLKSLMRQHKEKKREHEFSFMKRIRKFLKHTFD